MTEEPGFLLSCSRMNYRSAGLRLYAHPQTALASGHEDPQAPARALMESVSPVGLEFCKNSGGDFFFPGERHCLWAKHSGFFGCAAVDRLRSGALRQDTRGQRARTAGGLVANLGTQGKGKRLRPTLTFRSW